MIVGQRVKIPKKKTKGGGRFWGDISWGPLQKKNIATLSHSLHLFQAQASSGSYPTSYPPRLSMSDDQMECKYVAWSHIYEVNGNVEPWHDIPRVILIGSWTDPYNGLLQSLYNWVVYSAIHSEEPRFCSLLIWTRHFALEEIDTHVVCKETIDDIIYDIILFSIRFKWQLPKRSASFLLFSFLSLLTSINFRRCAYM